MHDRAGPDMRVVDDGKGALAATAILPQHCYSQLDAARGRTGWRCRSHADTLRLVLARERETLRRHRLPSPRHRKEDPTHGRPARAVRHGDREAPGAARWSTDRPHHEVGRDRDVERPGYEDGPPDFADRLIAVAVHDLALEREGHTGHHDPRADQQGRRRERLAAYLRGHAGPVVQRASERPPEEVLLRALGVLGHGDGEAARENRP